MALLAPPSWSLSPQAPSPEANAGRSANESQKIQALFSKAVSALAWRGLSPEQVRPIRAASQLLPLACGSPGRQRHWFLKPDVLGARLGGAGLKCGGSNPLVTWKEHQPRSSSPAGRVPSALRVGAVGVGKVMVRLSASPTCFHVAPFPFAR